MDFWAYDHHKNGDIGVFVVRICPEPGMMGCLWYGYDQKRTDWLLTEGKGRPNPVFSALRWEEMKEPVAQDGTGLH